MTDSQHATPLSHTEQQVADALADARHFAIRAETTDAGRLVVRRAMQITAERLSSELAVADGEAFQEAAKAPRCYECGSRDVEDSGLCGRCEVANDL